MLFAETSSGFPRVPSRAKERRPTCFYLPPFTGRWLEIAGQCYSGAGFAVVNSHPVKSEMSVATPKSQAKEPIQLDIVIVCRKATATRPHVEIEDSLASARAKLQRLHAAGFRLSRNDRKIVLYGQLLTTLVFASDANVLADYVDRELAEIRLPAFAAQRSMLLFQDD